MAFHTSTTREALMIEYDNLSRDRNGMNPNVSTYKKITARMEEIKKRLDEMKGDPEQFATDMSHTRNKAQRRKAMRRKGII